MVFFFLANEDHAETHGGHWLNLATARGLVHAGFIGNFDLTSVCLDHVPHHRSAQTTLPHGLGLTRKHHHSQIHEDPVHSWLGQGVLLIGLSSVCSTRRGSLPQRTQ